ncbi:hypothetical protein ZEAMMB73_Zm00001d036194 [Zea mays]|uniref:Uncharacterized protein n=1 Tax=Zea mays TaxID=4577 RepID=A0A1D6LL59_MAIZE|nr:hypothetical protein ZEAMMB73_Zm00001d036194 [Zea mays]
METPNQVHILRKLLIMILYQALNQDVTNHNTLCCLLWSTGYRAVLYMVGNQLSNTTTQPPRRKGKIHVPLHKEDRWILVAHNLVNWQAEIYDPMCKSEDKKLEAVVETVARNLCGALQLREVENSKEFSVKYPPHIFKSEKIKYRKSWYCFWPRYDSGLRFTGMPNPEPVSLKDWKREFFLSSSGPWPGAVDWGEPSRTSLMKSALTARERNYHTPWALCGKGNLEVDVLGHTNREPDSEPFLLLQCQESEAEAEVDAPAFGDSGRRYLGLRTLGVEMMLLNDDGSGESHARMACVNGQANTFCWWECRGQSFSPFKKSSAGGIRIMEHPRNQKNQLNANMIAKRNVDNFGGLKFLPDSRSYEAYQKKSEMYAL